MSSYSPPNLVYDKEKGIFFHEKKVFNFKSNSPQKSKSSDTSNESSITMTSRASNHDDSSLIKCPEPIKFYSAEYLKNSPVIKAIKTDKTLSSNSQEISPVLKVKSKTKEEKKDKCSKILTPKQIGPICWFMATIVVMFYSQRSRKILQKQCKKWDLDNELFIKLKDIFENKYLKNKEITDSANYKDFPDNTFETILNLLYNHDKKLFGRNPEIGTGEFAQDIYIGRLYNLLNIKCKIFEYGIDDDVLMNSLLNEEFNDDYYFNITYNHENMPRIYITKKYTMVEKKGILTKVFNYGKKIVKKFVSKKPDKKNEPSILIVIVTNKLKYTRDGTYPNNVIIDNHTLQYDISTMNDVLSYDDNRYKLDSVMLSDITEDKEYKPQHAIAGITCKNKRYIYNGWKKNELNTDGNYITTNVPCQLMRHDWNIKKDNDFCLNNIKCIADKGIERAKKGVHNKSLNELCFNFGEGDRVLIYVKEGIHLRTSSSSKESSKGTSPPKQSPPKQSPPTKSPKQSPPKQSPKQSPPKQSPHVFNFYYKFSDKPKGGELTPIYNSINIPYLKKDNKEAMFMASLNAGRHDLAVGGGGINAEFNRVIANVHHNPPIKFPETNDNVNNVISSFHKTCYDECETEISKKNIIKKGYFFHFKNLPSNIYIEDMFLYKSERDLYLSKSTDILDSYSPGDVYIDILKKEPYNNKANKVMIYCLGPDGRAMESKNIEKFFLNYVNIVGSNIASAIYEYNEYQVKKEKRIDYVRICLISGSIFLPSSMKDSNSEPHPNSEVAVAKQIISGIHNKNYELRTKLHKHNQDIEYDFVWTKNDAFKTAFNDINFK